MTSARAAIDDALDEPPGSWERWERIGALHRRGDDETFAAAAALLDSPGPDRRALAVDVLVQLGAGPGVPVEDRPHAAPAFALLLDLVESEEDADVLQSIATAFGHLRDPRGIPVLHGLRGHPDPEVRQSVAFALGGEDDDLAVETLVELSRDAEDEVRDWATFGLGWLDGRDDPLVAEALVARLDDPDDDTRAEALRGLARRGDERVIEPLLREAENPDADDSVIDEALLAIAARSEDPRLRAHVDR